MLRFCVLLAVVLVGSAPKPGLPRPVPHPADPSAAELADALGPVFRIESGQGHRYYLFYGPGGHKLHRVESRWGIAGTVAWDAEGQPVVTEHEPVYFRGDDWWIDQQGAILDRDGRPRRLVLQARQMRWKADGDRIALTLTRTDKGWSGTLRYRQGHQAWGPNPGCGQDYRVVHDPAATVKVTATALR